MVIGPATRGVAAQPLPLVGHVQPLVALVGIAGALRLAAAFLSHLPIKFDGPAGSPRGRTSLDVSPRPQGFQAILPVVTVDG